jgi:hypothetical protein
MSIMAVLLDPAPIPRGQFNPGARPGKPRGKTQSLYWAMRKVAVPLPYFGFFPLLRAELAAKYPGAKFAEPGLLLQGASLVEFLRGFDTAVIGLNRFTDEVCAALPELKVVSLCSAGVDHIDPAILRKHGIRMWWAPGINKISVSELAVCYMVYALRRAASAATCAGAPSASTAWVTSARK